MSNAVPDYFEPLIGYRLWIVQNGLLTPLTVSETPWKPYERLVSCHADSWMGENEPSNDGACLRDGCPACGIYALKTIEGAIQKADEYGLCWTTPIVIGSVMLWGTVVIHQDGYRAQYAYPKMLLGAAECDGPAIAKTYGIEFKEDPQWKSACQSRQLSWNQSPIPFQPMSPFAIRIPSWLLMSSIPRYGPNPPWNSQYILKPEDHKFIVEPPAPKAPVYPGLPSGMLSPWIETPEYYRTSAGVWAPCGIDADESSDADESPSVFWFGFGPKFLNVTLPVATKQLSWGFTT